MIFDIIGQMRSVFDISYFDAPYKDVTFPGKSEDERVLYVTREAPVILAKKMVLYSFAVAVFMLLGALLLSSAEGLLQMKTDGLVMMIILLGGVLMFGGLWWVWKVYLKTVFIITTRRLTKFIHTTPWTRYQMSLGLDKVVDSGSYTKGYFQAMFKLGTFVARSSAGNIKNFKIINIEYAEDLHNWMNKLMFTFNKETKKLDEFKPFKAKPIGKRD